MTDVCERIRRSGLVGLCLGVLLLAGMRIAQAADRVALVIGNGAYEHTITLPNPPNDARAMATLLRGLNFEVIEGEDLTKDALDAKLREFAKAAESAKVTFVFYAGHGMQVGGKNYLNSDRRQACGRFGARFRNGECRPRHQLRQGEQRHLRRAARRLP